MTGRYISRAPSYPADQADDAPDRVDEQDSRAVQKAAAFALTVSQGSVVAQRFQQRTFTGLSVHTETEFAQVEAGLSGIARDYGERDNNERKDQALSVQHDPEEEKQDPQVECVSDPPASPLRELEGTLEEEDEEEESDEDEEDEDSDGCSAMGAHIDFMNS